MLPRPSSAILRRARAPAADIAVRVDPRPLYPGDTVDAEVTVTPRTSFVVAAGIVRLAQTELLRVDSARDALPPMMLPRRGNGAPQLGGDPAGIDYVFTADTPMETGATYRYPVRLRLPAQAAPTVKGKHARITWELSASLLARSPWLPAGDGLLAGLTRARAGASTQELVVFAHPDRAAFGGERLPEKPVAAGSCRHASLRLALLAGAIPNGGLVEGALSVNAHRSFGARELRVELLRWERSGSKQARVVASRRILQRPATFAAGAENHWEFQLPVPDPLMPSVLARHTFVGWQVRAVIARALRPDFTVSQLVQIYTAPRRDGPAG